MINPVQFRQASAASLSVPPRGLQRHRCHTHLWEQALSRRRFLSVAAGAAGLMLGSSFLSPARAADCADPSPIPDGADALGNGTIYHVLLPGHPDFGPPDPATNNPAVIHDFNGDIGLAYVRGTGTHTDLTTGDVSHLPFEVDLRFMKGEYIGRDGRNHQGAFAFA